MGRVADGEVYVQAVKCGELLVLSKTAESYRCIVINEGQARRWFGMFSSQMCNTT